MINKYGEAKFFEQEMCNPPTTSAQKNSILGIAFFSS